MNELNIKINEHFSGLVVRKDLVKLIKGNSIVPSYVLEYLLGQYCASSDDANIQSGIETVKEILRKHYVHRNEAGLIKSTIKEKGRHKVIDKISVVLNEKKDIYEAIFSNLGIKNVPIDSATIKAHPKLLVSGVWCIADIEYDYTEDKNLSPWNITTLKPIQISDFDFDNYVSKRECFTTEEWIDLLTQSIGFNPEMFGKRSKLQQLIRLIPFCERNYNLIELGPKGTGKSHIYSDFSPHGILISGGEVTVAKLFVNNSSGKIGLVGYWDVVAFDEFAGKKKHVDNALVDILKNYMANKTFSRGVETLGADASMVFVGNTQHTLPYMLKHTNLFEELPDKYYDSAFLDRLHFYIPGWEVSIIRGEMFSNDYGFVVDYLAEILRSLRNYDYSHLYKEHFELCNDISTRDRDAINKTFSGLMKLLYPNKKANKEEIEEILICAIEGRKRVKDQLLKIDSTFSYVLFEYKSIDGKSRLIKTLEETQYPQYYNSTLEDNTDSQATTVNEVHNTYVKEEILKEQHLSFQENQKCISYDQLFGPYIKNAKKIIVTDPYIRMFFQARNLMEFMETVAKYKSDEEEVEVHLVTANDEYKNDEQSSYLERISEACNSIGILFTWEYSKSNSLHARHIQTDTGWKILLDRGLDIFQRFDTNDAFTFESREQRFRSCKAFEITYVKEKNYKFT